MKFKIDTAKGTRNCWLCDNPIKKGTKCLTTSIKSAWGYTDIHIHLEHLNKETIKELVVKSL